VKWLEISLATLAETAEAVADVLARFAPDGTAISGEPQTPGALLTVRAYLPEALAPEAVRQQVREAIWHLSQISPLPEPSFRLIDEEDWAENWKAHFHPMPVGRRLIVVPAWMAAEDPERIPLLLDPGMAFGTGAHPSTRMCLATLESLVQPGDLVVDLGCGSGILSVAAALFGAGHVLACDIDEEAVAATRRSAELNRVDSRIEVFQGSLPQAADRLAGRPAADIVVANILAETLRALLREGLADLVRDQGRLVLSGILADLEGSVEEVAGAVGLTLEQETFEQGWCTLTYRNLAASRLSIAHRRASHPEGGIP
jgi:ribosomal protein L11 methyltransferase